VRFRSKGRGREEKLLRSARRGTFLIAGVVVLLLLFNLSRVGRQSGQTAVPRAVSGQAVDGVAGELLPDEVQIAGGGSGLGADPAALIDKAGAAAMEAQVVQPAGLDDVPVALVRPVRDDVLGILTDEQDAMLATLRLAEKVLQGRLSEMPEARYAVFMDSPKSCRGKPWRLQGRLRRLSQSVLPRSAAKYGIRTAWDAWISTSDSGNQLVHVVALSKDARLPLLDSLGRDAPLVELAGYFFKREGYAARGADGKGDLALAPLLLTDRILRVVPRESGTRAEEMLPWLGWTAAGICLGVLALIWRFQRSDHEFRGTRTHLFTQPPVRPSFDGVAAVSLQEALKSMEEQSRAGLPDTSLTLPH
jgi:hypothetical protein